MYFGLWGMSVCVWKNFYLIRFWEDMPQLLTQCINVLVCLSMCGKGLKGGGVVVW